MNSIDYGLAARGNRLIAVTPSDATVYSPPLIAVTCGTSGTLIVTNHDDTTCTYPANSVIPGLVIPLPRVKKIAAASGALEIVGWQADQ